MISMFETIFVLMLWHRKHRQSFRTIHKVIKFFSCKFCKFCKFCPDFNSDWYKLCPESKSHSVSCPYPGCKTVLGGDSARQIWDSRKYSREATDYSRVKRSMFQNHEPLDECDHFKARDHHKGGEGAIELQCLCLTCQTWREDQDSDDADKWWFDPAKYANWHTLFSKHRELELDKHQPNMWSLDHMEEALAPLPRNPSSPGAHREPLTRDNSFDFMAGFDGMQKEDNPLSLKNMPFHEMLDASQGDLREAIKIGNTISQELNEQRQQELQTVLEGLTQESKATRSAKPVTTRQDSEHCKVQIDLPGWAAKVRAVAEDGVRQEELNQMARIIQWNIDNEGATKAARPTSTGNNDNRVHPEGEAPKVHGAAAEFIPAAEKTAGLIFDKVMKTVTDEKMGMSMFTDWATENKEEATEFLALVDVKNLDEQALEALDKDSEAGAAETKAIQKLFRNCSETESKDGNPMSRLSREEFCEQFSKVANFSKKSEEQMRKKKDRILRRSSYEELFYALDEDYNHWLDESEVGRFGRFVFGDRWELRSYLWKEHFYQHQSVSGKVNFIEFSHLLEKVFFLVHDSNNCPERTQGNTYRSDGKCCEYHDAHDPIFVKETINAYVAKLERKRLENTHWWQSTANHIDQIMMPVCLVSFFITCSAIAFGEGSGDPEL